jgi:hypothetical protein
MFRDLGVDVCSEERDEVVIENLVKLVDMCERGELPVTEKLVIALAQAVIVTLVPLLGATTQRSFNTHFYTQF